jgi:hypothetical protein
VVIGSLCMAVGFQRYPPYLYSFSNFDLFVGYPIVKKDSVILLLCACHLVAGAGDPLELVLATIGMSPTPQPDLTVRNDIGSLSPT